MEAREDRPRPTPSPETPRGPEPSQSPPDAVDPPRRSADQRSQSPALLHTPSSPRLLPGGEGIHRRPFVNRMRTSTTQNHLLEARTRREQPVMTPEVAWNTLVHKAKGRVGVWTNDLGCWLAAGKRVNARVQLKPKGFNASHLAPRLAIVAWEGDVEVIKRLEEGVGEASHLCGNRACIRPEHLTVEPHHANMRRVGCQRNGKCGGICQPRCL